jgi:hypothetical protein
MMTDALGGDISTFQYKRKADEGHKKKGTGKFHYIMPSSIINVYSTDEWIFLFGASHLLFGARRKKRKKVLNKHLLAIG